LERLDSRVTAAAFGLALVALLGVATVASADAGWQPPPPEFPDVTHESGIDVPIHTWESRQGPPEGLLDRLPPASPAIGDLNDDGYADAFVPIPGYTDENLQQMRDTESRLLLNDHSGGYSETFLDVTDVSNVTVDRYAYGAAWTDSNEDGHLDLLVTGYGFATLFENDGDATFTDVTQREAIPQNGLVLASAWGDVDEDGDLDLFLARYTPENGDNPPGNLDEVPGLENQLLLNTDDGFEPVQAGLDQARRSTSASIVDADDDGHLDVYITNYEQANTLWLGDGSGSFTEASASLGLDGAGASTCQAWTDIDNDADLDLFVANGDGQTASVYLNTTDGFDQAENVPGLDATRDDNTWGCSSGDFDNDGDRDVFLANSNVRDPQAQRTLLLENEVYRFPDDDVPAVLGPLQFNATYETVDLGEARATSGIATYDFNLDIEASLDVLTANHDLDRTRLYRNTGWQGGWGGGNGEFLRVWLDAPEGKAAIVGAEVTVTAGEHTVTKRVAAESSYGSSSLTDITFGLGHHDRHQFSRQDTDISLTVEWPDGTTDVYENEFGQDRAIKLTKGQSYTYDTVAPHVSRSLVDGTEGEQGWYTSEEVTLRVSARDEFGGGNRAQGVDTLAYSLDGETWTTVESPGLGTELTFEGEGTHPLWVRVTDNAGNAATTLYPVRLDATEPEATFVDPAAGGVYAQGEQLVEAGPIAGVDQAVVLAPQPVDPINTPTDAGAQPVRVNATDATAGVDTVTYQVQRDVPASTQTTGAERARTPYPWAWRAHTEPAGEYTLEATVEDEAGHQTETSVRVLVVPTTTQGAKATIDESPVPLIEPNVPDLLGGMEEIR